MNLQDAREVMPREADEWLFVYEWFAGWRWEHYRNGALASESLHNFEDEADCMADAALHGCGAVTRPASRARAEREKNALGLAEA